MKQFLIEKFKILGLAQDEALISVVYEEAVYSFKAYCGRDDIPEAAQGAIFGLMKFIFNRLGAEGLSSQSFSEVSEDFIDDYPANLIASLNRFRKLKAI